ncbi:M20 family metallopeptidase [Microbacterium sp. 2C]|uniref:M20/M25/M40 family metallo-hydrolase n=1 Tax=Microbacterium paulum TaxID=2707006 RepID=UPI0018C21931|nr:M20/M25/M40 family metallo-hydrolase [Microbacterium paulum]MBG0718017.1 M20 family metallopeptidase [Microbacterium paulum]
MTEPSIADVSDDDLQRALRRLQELVRIESPSLDADASHRVSSLLAWWWRECGAHVREVTTDAGTSVIADVDGVGAPVLFVGHSDTVWPHGTLAEALPLARESDTLTGPGVYDMKSGLVVMLAAVAAVRRVPHRAVRVVVVCDEEVGSPTTGNVLREAAEGVTAVLGFESPHPDGALKVGRRGSTRVRLRVRGVAAHAALDPGAGVSAIDELIDQLLEVRRLVGAPDLRSEVLCNVGSISGGARANVVAADAEAEIGLRFEDPETERRVLGAIERLRPVRERARLEVEILSHRPAWRPSDADQRVADDLARAARRAGAESLPARPAAGAGDTNSFGAWGLPTVDGLGPRGGGAHALSEHVLVSSLGERISLIAAYLADVGVEASTVDM